MTTRTATLLSTSAPAAPTSTMAARPTAKVRSYKDFLTPAMHRRFTQATLATLVLCYVEAVVMSQKGIFWRVFPFGMTGIRTLLLFLPCLGVFIVRLANLHVGERNTTAGYETFYQQFAAPRSWFTLLWYVYSACFFGEVYIWSRGQEANLGWVDMGRSFERPRLNENPIILRSLYILLAVAQTCLHLYYDYDLVSIPECGNEEVGQTDGPKQLPKAYFALKAKIPDMFQWSCKVTTAGMVAVSPIYFIFLRRTAWTWCYAIGRILFSQLPKNAAPTGLIYFPGLVWQGATSSLMVVMLWEVSNTVFTAAVASPPLKKDYPLTNEVKDAAGNIISKSQDPNGSLLTGLKSKREVPKTFAFWELYIISTQFDARRRSFFTDVDRKDGATWSQVSTLCLNEIEAMRMRKRAFLQPAETDAQRKQREYLDNPQQASVTLPKIANRGVQDGNVFVQQPSNFPHSVGNIAKSIGQHPNAQYRLSPKGKQLLEWGTDRVLSREQRAQLSRQGFNSKTTNYALRFLRTPLGLPFRERFDRMIRVVVFGVPHSNRVNIVHATRALTALVLASLNEDDYGLASKDIPKIIRSLTATIKELRAFVAGLEPSWTDVEFQGRYVKDVEEVVAELERSLGKILLAFGEYASSLGLSKKEIREAKEVVGKEGSEMVERGR